MASTLTGQAKTELDKFMAGLIRRNPGEPEFHQAVNEVVETLIPYTLEHPIYREASVRFPNTARAQIVDVNEVK